MRRSAWLLSLFLCGCASKPLIQVQATHTLAGDFRLPAGDIESQFSPAKWQKLRDLEYAAFVVMDAQIHPDGSLHIGNVRDSYPDASWHNLARLFSEEIVLSVAAVGSHIEPEAEVYVVFFKPSLDGSLALIFAKQKDSPPPGMTRKAMYLRTRFYSR